MQTSVIYFLYFWHLFV